MNDTIINHSREINILYKIVDKLEQRISSLEKVLASHAKCIGEIRGGESKDPYINLMEKGEGINE